jgi:hypothetical protein
MTNHSLYNYIFMFTSLCILLQAMLADAFSALGCDVSSGKLSWQRLCTMLKGDGKSGSSGNFNFSYYTENSITVKSLTK